jgi:predicted phosphohydrolase
MTSGVVSIKLAWITDPHLDHLEKKDPDALARLGSALDREDATHILLGGDISDSRSFEDKLSRFSKACRRPIYYVLGNHDYYFGSIAEVRKRAAAMKIPGVQWLPSAGVVDLGGGTALIGHGGWGDARRGDLENFIIFTDYAAISDLAVTIDREDFWVKGFTKRKALVKKLQQLGREAAEALRTDLENAVAEYRRILILTHVPPFTQTCTYKDGPGTDLGFPGFLWDTMGGILSETAASHPDIEFLTFSGHTHQESRGNIGQNLRAWSASAEYGETRYRIIDPKKSWSPGPSIKV